MSTPENTNKPDAEVNDLPPPSPVEDQETGDGDGGPGPMPEAEAGPAPGVEDQNRREYHCCVHRLFVSSCPADIIHRRGFIPNQARTKQTIPNIRAVWGHGSHNNPINVNDVYMDYLEDDPENDGKSGENEEDEEDEDGIEEGAGNPQDA